VATGYRHTLGSSESKEEENLNSTELARKIVDMLEERLAADILMLDVNEVTVLADYFVLCTANSERQTRALVGDLSKQLKAEVGSPLGIEGRPESGWVLLDYGDVVVHVFGREMREFYALEELWKGAQTIVHIQ